MLTRFLRDERGVTAIEYGVIAGMVFVVIVAGVSAVGANVSGLFNTVASNLLSASGG